MRHNNKICLYISRVYIHKWVSVCVYMNVTAEETEKDVWDYLIYSIFYNFKQELTKQKNRIQQSDGQLTSVAKHSQHLGQKESHVQQVCESKCLCSKNPESCLLRETLLQLSGLIRSSSGYQPSFSGRYLAETDSFFSLSLSLPNASQRKWNRSAAFTGRGRTRRLSQCILEAPPGRPFEQLLDHV